MARRGAVLTMLAVLFAILAISDLLKPFHLEGPDTGLVFFGTRLSGVPNAIIGALLGIFLLTYAAGIWRMKRYVLPVAFGYAIYVALNLILFSLKNAQPPNQLLFGIIYTVLAIGFSWGTAILIWRRRAELT